MNKIEWLLKDITYNAKFEVLEEAKNKSEIQDVAKKRGVRLPCHDLAVFKCIYAYVDRMNKNGCTLPKEEVEKALDTLIGKAVDFDHFRKRICGHWIDAFIDKDQIVAYGLFYKGNLQEEYKDVKELMNDDRLAVSFEAWGDKNYGMNDNYSLSDIEFAGGGLLLKSQPAFPGSEVTEMSKKYDKTRVLEFAKVMTEPEKFIHTGEEGAYKCTCIKCGNPETYEDHCINHKCSKCGGQMRRADRPGPGQGTEDLPELARYYIWDFNEIMKLVNQVDCLSCKEKGMMDVLMMDFENNTAKVKCINCNAVMKLNLTPTAKLVKKGRKIKSVIEVKEGNLLVEDIIKFAEEFEGSDEELEMTIVNQFEGKLEEGKTLTYKERQRMSDDMFAVVKTVKNKKTGKSRKIRMFPIHDKAHVRNALARLSQATQTLKKLGVSIDSVRGKILKRARELKMKQLLERYKKATVEEVLQEIAKTTIEKELTEDEMTKAKAKVDEKGENITDEEIKAIVAEFKKVVNAPVKSEAEIKAEKEKAEAKKLQDLEDKVEELGKEVTKLKDEVDKNDKAYKSEKKAHEEAKAKLDKFEKVEKDRLEKEKADKIKARKEKLGDSAKDMKDEDILDDLKFENALLKKKLNDKGVKIEKADLIVGAAGKNDEGKITDLAGRIKEQAFPKK